jgi:hypothetical protein
MGFRAGTFGGWRPERIGAANYHRTYHAVVKSLQQILRRRGKVGATPDAAGWQKTPNGAH